MIFRGLWVLAWLRGSLGGLVYLQMFVIEQALWRGWESVVLRENNFGAGFFKTLSDFKMSGVVTTQFPADDTRHGVVYFWPAENITYTKSSTLVISEPGDFNSLLTHLNQLPLTITTDMILATYELRETKETMTIQQVYKKGPLANITIRTLGDWEMGEQPAFRIQPPESRTADLDAFITIGVKNTSVLDENGVKSFAAFVEKDEEVTMLTLLRSLFSAMNISYELEVFSKLGWKTTQGGWTHLLGAIADGSVDVAADTVDQNTNDGSNALLLSDPIVQTMSCVYFRKSGNGRLHDVVRATFSNELQISVLCTGVLLWIAMLAITVTTARYCDNDSEFWEPTEALIWTISILCMQGSPWAPKSLSGCILLIFSLIFALITYNSYAAFITSVLSVRTNPFRSVEDLIDSDYEIGFIRGSADEYFFLKTENPALRAFYFRGLLADGSASNITQGIQRASEEHYAFFAMARLARRALQMDVPPQWRCRLNELCVDSTRTSAGIPLSRASPYNILIHYWLLRLRETGILARIKSRLLPPMPTCSREQLFYGATASDLLSAYFLFFLGLMASIVIFIIEVIWARRKRLFRIFGVKKGKFKARRLRTNNWTYLY